MTTTVDQQTRVHPIARFATRAREVIGTLADAPAWSMTPDEQRAALCDLVSLEAQVAELKGRVLVAGTLTRDQSAAVSDALQDLAAAVLAFETDRLAFPAPEQAGSLTCPPT